MPADDKRGVPQKERKDSSGRVHKPERTRRLSEAAKQDLAVLGKRMSMGKLPLRITERSNPAKEHEIRPNSRSPVFVENGNCIGHTLFKLRTNPPDAHYQPYFEGRKRMFEVMVQGHLLNISPDDQVYMGIMGDKPLAMNSWLGSWTSSAMIAFIKLKVKDVHVTLGNEHEAAHLMMPVFSCADRFVITSEGDDPPEMGVPMFPEQVAKNERKDYRDWNTKDTYSLSMHGMYVDFVKWKVVNIPGLPDMCLSTFLGDMPLNIVAYALPRGHTGPHLEKDKRYIVSFKLEHESIHSML
ncbi:hypothetical protein SARC_09182 [Sphaeroforma arctica JP610]|uniref:Domain of unknown function at the cortex 1 domain-containing protein n=1 Tax=Sphaeroforma arctica JP610 TaxID=667725 RepID=A0A0L0FNI7_9EUKA|nr:hypothetical protein SARC_09182 [Sphaeroforma arctica JP610]KNC78380.1 hypothetical protein SARC_09182 [Sphaeroforma arctica JP610]|eukprot:XP_014152282.1 hypothetical protein SARC_09182 [Sphaeroforma arctica JP610]